MISLPNWVGFWFVMYLFFMLLLIALLLFIAMVVDKKNYCTGYVLIGATTKQKRSVTNPTERTVTLRTDDCDLRFGFIWEY
jgi:hypothetical protein